MFKVEENKELAVALNCSAQAISNWKKDGVPAIVERRAIEILKKKGIVSEPETPYLVPAAGTKKPSQLFIEGLIATFNDEQLKEAARAILEVEAREDLKRTSSQ